MTPFFRLLVSALAAVSAVLVFGAAAPAAQEAFVTAATLNCRDAASPDAKLVTKLGYRDRVAIQTEEAGWANIRVPGGPNCWVSLRYLSGDEPAARAAPESRNYSRPSSSQARQLGSSGSTRARQPASSGSSKARRSSQPQAQGGGACPCSGSKVCIGPRGGRYCITSGGNKRYGVSGYAAPRSRLLGGLRYKST